MNLQRYNKFTVAIVTAIISGLSILYSDATWLPIVINLAGALGVYTMPNKPNYIIKGV